MYNRWDRLPRCLAALDASRYLGLRTLIVDNASTVPVPRDVAPLLARYGVLRTPRNLGYAGGNNVGIRRAMELRAEYVLLINDDAYVAPAAIQELVDAMQATPDAGAVGPLILDSRDPSIVQSAGGLWAHDRLRAHHRGRWDRDRGQYGARVEADFVDGSCLLLRVEALRRAGLFDEGFFLYYEEVELCARLRDYGYRCLVVPSARVEHEGGGDETLRSPVSRYFSHRNRFLFVRRRWRGLGRAVRIAWALGTEADVVTHLLRTPRERWVRARARGVLDGVLGVEGPGPAWIHARTARAPAARDPPSP